MYTMHTAMSNEELPPKARNLRKEALNSQQIADELSLSQDTISWLLAGSGGDDKPLDVSIGWRTIGVAGSRINAISEIMADVILEEQEKRSFELDMVAGVTHNGIPLATIVSDLLGIDFGMIRPSREGTQTNYAVSYTHMTQPTKLHE